MGLPRGDRKKKHEKMRITPLRARPRVLLRGVLLRVPALQKQKHSSRARMMLCRV